MKKIGVFLLLCLVSNTISAQIELTNPSFEGTPNDATMPSGWQGCDPYTTPDIMPGNNEWGEPIWDVTHSPVDGKTYVGLITREDHTYEYIGQPLTKSVIENNCYMFSVNLACSPFYAGYNTPIRLRVWLGNKLCEKEELIAETEKIAHYDWKNYEFIFSTKKGYRYIIFEATYAKDAPNPYRGNILIDDVSVIKDCDRV